MANVAHSDLTDPNLHEPKGVAGAAEGNLYIADGGGSGDWHKANAFGAVHFLDIASPFAVTYPAVYTKAAPTTSPQDNSIEVTEAATARLTYTGTRTRRFMVTATICISQSAGANRDLLAKIYKNGVAVANSEVVITTTTALLAQLTTFTNVSLETDDYVELYVMNDGASGDVDIHTFHLSMESLV